MLRSKMHSSLADFSKSGEGFPILHSGIRCPRVTCGRKPKVCHWEHAPHLLPLLDTSSSPPFSSLTRLWSAVLQQMTLYCELHPGFKGQEGEKERATRTS